MSIDISIIVPVYNAENYLTCCIESLLKQTITSFELILVDDGSTDNSIGIIKKYQRLDSRIKLFTQQNQYAGIARNKGLSYATGKYVIFLDADDYFEHDMLESAYNVASINNADIVIFGNWRFDNTGEKKDPFTISEKKVKSANDLGQHIFVSTRAVPWNKLIRRSFILDKKIEFQDVPNGNDEFFSRAACVSADRIVFLNKRFVHYRINNTSSLQGNLKSAYKNITTVIKIPSRLKTYMRDNNLYVGQFVDAYKKYAIDLLESRIRYSFGDFSAFSSLYCELKENMVPRIFDSSNDYDNSLLEYINNSCDACECLCMMLKHYNTLYVEKNCSDYIVGNHILEVLRRIRYRKLYK